LNAQNYRDYPTAEVVNKDLENFNNEFFSADCGIAQKQNLKVRLRILLGKLWSELR